MTTEDKNQNSFQNKVLVQLAETRKDIEHLTKDSQHRHANLQQSIKVFVPRHEIENMIDSVSDDVKRVEVRVVKLEEARDFIAKQIVKAALTSGGLSTAGVTTLAMIGRKLGLL